MAVAVAVRVRFLARLRDLTGKDTEELKAPADWCVSDVYDAMRVTYPALPPRDSIRAAVNHEFADWNSRVSKGDEVAFIPPVSGGA
jgi:molybdopterin converting factor subunit 1